jgi:dTDP-4-amino-4,6-dideoxygalactose transaminase
MVPFLDLRRRITSMRPRLEARLNGVLEAGRFILGDMVAELEDAFPRYCGVRYGVAVASGTDALWLALKALGVGASDEVITVSNTCVPTIAAILQSGATPVLIDIDPCTFTMGPELAEASLTSRTKCLLPVHLYGQCADMRPLRALAESHGVWLVEDCAQALGSDVTPPLEAESARHVYHLYVVKVQARARYRDQLKACGVETMIHYPLPVHQQAGYGELCKVGRGGLDRTERLSGQILSLPVFPELYDAEIQAVIDAVAGRGIG